MVEKSKIAENMKRSKRGIKKKLKDKQISEDDNTNFEKNIQKITDDNIQIIERFLLKKKKKSFRYERLKPYCLYNGWHGRWGKNKNKGRKFGHLKGVQTKKDYFWIIKVKHSDSQFLRFSTENWRRPKTEINFLFKLIHTYFSEEIKSVVDQGVKINVIGELKKLPKRIQKILKQTVSLTRKNKKIEIYLAINYGSKNEILNTFKKIKKKINLKTFEKNLYTKDIPDPDIMIRTGGHKRLSNFMLWQLAYTELYFIKKLWPDFQINDLKK